jgi:Na+/H+ antiporter NhaD/arsenite permease-like protein
MVFLARLMGDRLSWILLALALPLWILHPSPTLSGVAGLVDWNTLAALAGLLALSRALQESGALDALGDRIVSWARTERRLALLLVLFAAALSAVVTNDVALFVVVPLTLGLGRGRDLPVGRLVVFEALGVNAGSALSPIGNPQNLVLWQTSPLGFWSFTLLMLPLGVALLVGIMAMVPLGFENRPLHAESAALPLAGTASSVREPSVRERIQDRVLLRGAVLLYPAFLVLTEIGLAPVGALLVLGILGRMRPAVLGNLDWGLLLVILLMFVDLGLLAGIPSVQEGATHVATLGGGAFFGSVLLSQVISNVPAALFLLPFTPDLRGLAWGVSVGGFGLLIGSLANIIALRLANAPGLWREFHRWSIPALVYGILVGILLGSLYLS